MNWIPLTDLNQLETIKDLSFTSPQVILKHSTTCSISKMALARMERSEAPDSIQFYYLDLLNYRPISNAIAEKFNSEHIEPIEIKILEQSYNSQKNCIENHQ